MAQLLLFVVVVFKYLQCILVHLQINEGYFTMKSSVTGRCGTTGSVLLLFTAVRKPVFIGTGEICRLEHMGHSNEYIFLIKQSNLLNSTHRFYKPCS